MSSLHPADLLALLERALAHAPSARSSALDLLLRELGPLAGEADPERTRASLEALLPELEALRDVPPPEPSDEAPLSLEQAQELLARLSRAWSDRDGPAMDAVLAELEPPAAASAEDEARWSAEASASISQRLAGFSLRPLGDPQRR